MRARNATLQELSYDVIFRPVWELVHGRDPRSEYASWAELESRLESMLSHLEYFSLKKRKTTEAVQSGGLEALLTVNISEVIGFLLDYSENHSRHRGRAHSMILRYFSCLANNQFLRMNQKSLDKLFSFNDLKRFFFDFNLEYDHCLKVAILPIRDLVRLNAFMDMFLQLRKVYTGPYTQQLMELLARNRVGSGPFADYRYKMNPEDVFLLLEAYHPRLGNEVTITLVALHGSLNRQVEIVASFINQLYPILNPLMETALKQEFLTKIAINNVSAEASTVMRVMGGLFKNLRYPQITSHLVVYENTIAPVLCGEFELGYTNFQNKYLNPATINIMRKRCEYFFAKMLDNLTYRPSKNEIQQFQL